MSVEEYWIGKGINLEKVWLDYDNGLEGYSNKYRTMKVHSFQLEFNFPAEQEPLFDHEVIYKTVKSLFHDTKQSIFSESEYNESGPIFLYEIKRGSAEWVFLGELGKLVWFGLGLYWTYLKVRGEQLGVQLKKQEIFKNKLHILKDELGINISSDDFERNWNKVPKDLEKYYRKLVSTGLTSIKISKSKIQTSVEDKKIDYFDYMGGA